MSKRIMNDTARLDLVEDRLTELERWKRQVESKAQLLNELADEIRRTLDTSPLREKQ